MSKFKKILPFVALLLPVTLFAYNLSFKLKLNQTTLALNADLTLDNSQEIFSVVRDGVNYKLFWDLEVFEVNDSIIENDKILVKQTIKREVSYSEISREYIVIEEGNKFHFDNSFSLAKYIFNYSDDEVLEDIPRGKVYRIQMRVRGESIKLVFPLDVVMKWFAKIYDFSTGWKAKEFQLK